MDESGADVLGQKLPEQATQLVSNQFDHSLPTPLVGPSAQLGEFSRPLPYAPVLPRESSRRPLKVVPLEPSPYGLVQGGVDRAVMRVPLMAQPVIAASGRRYTFIVVIPPFSIRTFVEWFGIEKLLRLAAVLVIAGTFCFWLAHHITAPVVQLRQAANKIAVGDFGARVSATMSGRKDEIGVLGRQFDRMAERI